MGLSKSARAGKKEDSVNSSHQELVWKGRLHLGDEPGIYGDAAYAGTGVDLPVTLYPLAADVSGADVTIVVEAEHVKTYDGYAGHR